jgi:hypothetical protein
MRSLVLRRLARGFRNLNEGGKHAMQPLNLQCGRPDNFEGSLRPHLAVS